jgi:hypothetical protein
VPITSSQWHPAIKGRSKGGAGRQACLNFIFKAAATFPDITAFQKQSRDGEFRTEEETTKKKKKGKGKEKEEGTSRPQSIAQEGLVERKHTWSQQIQPNFQARAS